MTGSTGRFIAQKSPGRPRKIDWQELEPDIPANPSQLLRKPAHQLGVWPNAIRYACRQMKMNDKKTFAIRNGIMDTALSFFRRCIT